MSFPNPTEIPATHLQHKITGNRAKNSQMKTKRLAKIRIVTKIFNSNPSLEFGFSTTQKDSCSQSFMDPSNVLLPLYPPSRDGACLTRVSYNIERVPNQARAGMAANLSISLFGRISFVMFRGRIRNSRSQSALRSARVVQITDPEDARVTLYKARSQRDCTTFDLQVRDLAEAAMQSRNLALNLECLDVSCVFLFFNLSPDSSQ